jgi:hypothetical protein
MYDGKQYPAKFTRSGVASPNRTGTPASAALGFITSGSAQLMAWPSFGEEVNGESMSISGGG